MKCTQQNFVNFYFCGSGRSNWQLFYLTHILCSCTLQYECEDALDDFGVQEIFVGSDAGSETVLGQMFASTNFMVWDSFANIAKICTSQKKSIYTV